MYSGVHTFPVASRPSFLAVGIGASWGGLEALHRLLARLPPKLPAPIAVVHHLRRSRSSLLAKTLSASTSLTVKFAEDREPFVAGSVYLASPDRHLVVAENCTLSNGSRPLFSPSPWTRCFESMPRVFGPAGYRRGTQRQVTR